MWSLECGVWSFGRADRFYFINTFVPDCIYIFIWQCFLACRGDHWSPVLQTFMLDNDLWKNYGLFKNKTKSIVIQPGTNVFSSTTQLHDRNCPLSIVHCQLIQSVEFRSGRQVLFYKHLCSRLYLYLFVTIFP